MHPHLKSLLVKAGCAPDATDDDAQQYYDGLVPDRKAEIDAALSALMESDSISGGNAGGGDAALSAGQIADIATQAAIAALDKLGGNRQQGQQGQQQQQSGIASENVVSDDDALVAAEGARVARIRQMASLFKIPDSTCNVVIAEGGTIEEARTRLLKHMHDTCKPISAAMSVGNDQKIAALASAIPQALCMRSGGMTAENFAKLGEKVHPMTAQLRCSSLIDMGRTWLISLGANPSEVYGMSRPQLAASLGPRGMRRFFPKFAALAESTPDFANITLDAINKALRFSYLDQPADWSAWAEKKFAPDFKTINSIALSEAPSMISADEGGEMKYVTLTDSKETSRLRTYKAGIRLTRNAIINDDLDAFSNIPRFQAQSANRLEDDVAYALITANGTMADTGALFNSTAVTTAGGHANYTSSGGAPSVAQLQTGATAMMKQKGLAGVARLELRPKYLLVPTSIYEATRQFVGSEVLVASQSSSGSAPPTLGSSNPFYNRYDVVGSTRLDDNSTSAWYMLADWRAGRISTFQMYFLTDEPEPVLRQETDFDTEDVKYLVRHTVAGMVCDFRGAYKNAG